MSDGDGDVTIGELSRMITRMDTRFTVGLAEVNRRLDGLQFVNRETYGVQMAALDTRIGRLEEKDTWRSRALVVSFLFPVIVGIVLALAVAR